MDRFATNGDSNVAFWFFVEPVGLTGATSGGFSGLHTAGVVAANGTVTTPGDLQVLRPPADRARCVRASRRSPSRGRGESPAQPRRVDSPLHRSAGPTDRSSGRAPCPP